MKINHPYYDIANNMNIEKGETIILTANFSLIFYQAQKLNIDFDINKFVDTFIDRISDTGNIIIPSYEWSFSGPQKTYDYNNTKTQTGVLSDTVILRNEFKRTLHPVNSHLVFGKNKSELTSKYNIDAFYGNSDFDEMYKLDPKYVLIGLQFKGFSFLHYFEQKYPVPYRYNKFFSGKYIDENNNISTKKCALYVRRMETDNTFNDYNMSNILLKNNAGKKYTINDISHHVYDVKASEPFIRDDILNNHAYSFNKFKDDYNPFYQNDKYIELFAKNNFEKDNLFNLLKKEYFGELNILSNKESKITIMGFSDNIIEKTIILNSVNQLIDTIKNINNIYNTSNRDSSYIFNMYR